MTETKTPAQSGDTTAQTGAGEYEKVPEGAEDMEHTLRRLVAEKEKKRAKHPELYL